MASYMIRAMRSAKEDFDVFFNNSVVAVGWNELNFSDYESLDELLHSVELHYYPAGDRTAPQVAGKRKNEIRRFKGIKKGDKIVIPYWGSVRLAVASGEEKFSVPDMQRDLGNQHVVSFIQEGNGDYVTIPREQLSEGLQRRLRVPGSGITDLSDFDEEVENLFNGEAFISTIARVQNDQERLFKTKLLNILQEGTSALQAGGIGLEKLVANLLEVDGYHVDIQSKSRFSGIADADIVAIRDDHLASTKLLVQVKHHSGESDEWGAQQLSHILETEPDLFAEYRLVLVTSGRASTSLMELCEKKDITLVTGAHLVDWITDSLEKISPKMRIALRISDVPQLVGE